MPPKENLAYSGLEAEKPKEVIDPIKKLFIANRGEIAVRAIKACEKRGIPAVIAYMKQDKNTLATRMATEKGNNGNGAWGTVEINSYIYPDDLVNKATETGCDAIFLGYGFLSEDSNFVEKCEKAGLIVLAPPSEVMKKFIKDKVVAKKTAKGKGLNIPTLPSKANIGTLEEASIASKKLGFPVMLKVPDSGGGRGNCIVFQPEDLEKKYKALTARLKNKTIFIEPYIENAIHVEFQIVADRYGNVVSLGERDCTMQRRNQKIIEESPSPNIEDEKRKKMQEVVIKLIKKIGYQGIGTVEFILNKDKRGLPWYFMEINPRIQVEHGVTEERTGIDLVNLMMDIAEGKPLPFIQEDIILQNHTVEARLYAEDSDGLPCPGIISDLSLPEGKNIRIDTGIEKGDEVLIDFEGLLSKMIAIGLTRNRARVNLINYLRKIEIDGIQTNKDLLIKLLSSKEFRRNKTTTTLVEKVMQKIKRAGVIFERKK